MVKRPWLTFVTGLVCGAIIVGFAWFSSILGEALRSWGKAQVFFDAEAREQIADDKLKPSSSATDVFYFIDGFQDHRIFTAFTDTSDQIDRVIVAATGKHMSELEPWGNQIVKDWQLHPGNEDAKYPSSLYDLGGIKKGRFFQSPSTSSEWHLIVDEEKNRLYYGYMSW